MRRSLEAHDFDQVYAIYMHPAVVPFLGFDLLTAAEFQPLFDELLGSGDVFVHEIAGVIAGFYRLTRHDGRSRHVAYLSTLAVDPALRSRGIASSMLTEAIGELRQQGVRRLYLLVEADNPRAIAFYHRHGFELEGTLRQAYKRSDEAAFVDELLMARLLD